MTAKQLPLTFQARLKKKYELTGSLVVVDIDAFQLKGAVTDIFAFWVNSMFVGNDLPKLFSRNQIAEEEIFEKRFRNAHENLYKMGEKGGETSLNRCRLVG